MEQRRTRRFQLELPLSIIRTGGLRVTFAGRTKNISSSGVLFTAGREPDLGGAIEYIITLNQESLQPVQLRCIGKVMRTARADSGANGDARTYEIAATLERYEFVRERVQRVVATA